MFWALLSLSQSFYYAPPTAVLPASQQETAFLQIINDFRSNLRLQRLSIDDRLAEAAQNHAIWMSNYHVLTHVGPRPWWKSYTRMYAAGIPVGTLVGENIARGSFTAKNTFIQWFFSQPHLDGMMTPEYDHIGISREGCTDDEGKEIGLCYWVTDFAQINEEQKPQSQIEPTYTKEQIVDAAEKVIGPLDPERKDLYLHPPVYAPVSDQASENE